MKRKTLILIPMLGLGLLLAACGGQPAETTTEESVAPADKTETMEENTTIISAGDAIDTPDNAANTFCNKMHEMEAAAEADKARLEGELNDLENRIEAEHDGDDNWFNEFETKLEAICPEA